MNKVIIELNNISLNSKNNKILSNINLKIYEGEKIALIGKSGSGKTSLISILNGTKKQTNGDLKIFDKTFKELDIQQRREIGTIWQDLRLIDDLSVEQNVNCGLLGKENFIFAFKNLLNIESFKKAHNCMELFRLERKIFSSNISKISGGQRQRIAIARTIIQEPKILYADEPFKNLDPKTSSQIKSLFFSKDNPHNIKMPKTQLISLHKLELLNGFNKVIGIRNGSIIFKMKTKYLTEYHLKKIY
tara:strand:- start:7093 stop:7830 length:738 start_codon:yes stop_codon:yes gene_type:complete